ncbi:MAG: hypothetical protein NT079_00035 [Candidatus Omnitrophica bacterium]|nr:hypothetical protein [Candidatus Omnitrophota bacterium]
MKNILFKKSKLIFITLTIAFGIWFNLPSTNFAGPLASGDHGRDLYAFQETLKGAQPYQNYWWVYGPLMPYYYALSFKILGVSIQSVLTAKFVLVVASGLFIFLTLLDFIPALVAFAATLWFWCFQPDFFYTYNHIGGIFFSTLILFFLSQYFSSANKKYLYAGLISIFGLCLVKVNVGLFGLISFLLSCAIFDYAKNKNILNKKLYLHALWIIPLSSFSALWFFVRRLHFYEIRQCFPYLKGDYPFHVSLWDSFFSFSKTMILNFTSWSLSNFVFGLIIFICFLRFAWLFLTHKKDPNLKNTFLFLLSLIIFIFFFLNEFWSSAILYTVRWIFPFQLVLMFTLIGTTLKYLPNRLRLVCSIPFFLLALSFCLEKHSALQSFKKPNYYFAHKKAKVYLKNMPSWINTVTQTTTYLEKNLKKDENIFALPYDPLFYFLLDRTSPTRQLIFFDHIRIKDAQEKEIIKSLKENNASYIIISNRSSSKEPGLGTFGITYCPLIFDYIQKNFTLIETFGDWQNEPGWAGNYGTKILKKIQK